jgi:hypothetical protein
MANESALWKWFKGKLPMAGLHMERVENVVALSTPDVEGQLFEHHFHIELKVLRDRTYIGKPNEGGRLKFQVGQREWAAKRWEVGGTSWIMIQGFTEIYMIPGALAMAMERIGTAKTAFLRELSYKTVPITPMGRSELYAVLRNPHGARAWVAETLRLDPQLLAKARPTSALDLALDSILA